MSHLHVCWVCSHDTVLSGIIAPWVAVVVRARDVWRPQLCGSLPHSASIWLSLAGCAQQASFFTGETTPERMTKFTSSFLSVGENIRNPDVTRFAICSETIFQFDA